MTFRLLWVPPGLKMQTIERIVQSTFGAEATACRPIDTKDQGRVDVTLPYEKDFDPPHYLEVDRMGKQGKVEQTLWFVSVKGRRQQCHYCHSPHLWPIRCPTKNAPPKTRAEEVLGRRAEQAKTEPTRRAQQAPTNTIKEPTRRAAQPPPQPATMRRPKTPTKGPSTKPRQEPQQKPPTSEQEDLESEIRKASCS